MRLRNGFPESDLAFGSGRACFLPLENSLQNFHIATKNAILADKEEFPYVVIEEIDYYPGMLNTLLSDEVQLLETLEKYKESMQGSENGALRCVSLLELRSMEGVLFHRFGDKIYGAYVPPDTKDVLLRELDIARRLSDLIDDSAGIIFRLDTTLPAGAWRLNDALLTLLRCLQR